MYTSGQCKSNSHNETPEYCKYSFSFDIAVNFCIFVEVFRVGRDAANSERDTFSLLKSQLSSKHKVF